MPPERGELRCEKLPAPGPGEALVRTLDSGISKGAELVVHRAGGPARSHLRTEVTRQHVFSLTVRRHFMIAHSLPREAFGPALGMHGATFVAEVSFRRRELNADVIVLDIGEAGTVPGSVLDGLKDKNLGEHPDFAGKLSTREALARYIAEAVAA